MLKQAKFTGSLKVTSASDDKKTVIVRVTTEKQPAPEVYLISRTGADDYTFLKCDTQDRYTTSTWDQECTCDGRKNGYLCRHLRMLSALQFRNAIS